MEILGNFLDSKILDGIITSKIDVQLDMPSGCDRLSGDLDLTIFCVVQESLTNILRHSESATARITMLLNDGYFQCEISDNGKGISTAEQIALTSPVSVGVGIRGMRERIRQLSGTLQRESNGKGTTVSIALPISHEETAKANPLSRTTRTSKGD